MEINVEPILGDGGRIAGYKYYYVGAINGGMKKDIEEQMKAHALNQYYPEGINAFSEMENDIASIVVLGEHKKALPTSKFTIHIAIEG